MKPRITACLLIPLAFLLFASMPVPAETFKVKSMVTPSGRVEYVKGEVLVKYKAGLDEKNMARLATRLGTQEISVHGKEIHKLRVPAGMTELEFISLLEDSPEVEFAELNTICHASFVPNDPFYSPYQWHFPSVNSEQAWDISTGTSALVAILDTGIAYEDYAVPSYELSTVKSGVTQYQQAPDLAGTSFGAGYDFINNDTHPNDNNGHGTHVAGTVAQTTNNSYGTAGLAFDCTLMPVKVLDYTGSGTASSLIDGLHYAADNGAKVASMSLSWSPGYDPGTAVHDAIIYAYNKGVVLVAASGNSGVSTVSYPAAYSEVIAVGATRYDDQLTSYSQYGTAQELVAPGGDVSVDQNSDGYGDGVLQQTFDAYDPGPPEVKADPTSFSYWFYQGTSMATPHVAAVVAMLIANGQTGVENIRTILHETAVDLGTSGWDQQYGYGKVDAYAALTYGGAPPVAAFSGSPTNGCAPLTVDFTDESTGEITSWDWDFGDGSAHSNAQNPTHQYASAGDYTVALTVTGPGGSDTETKNNYIHVDSAPSAAFTATPTSGCAPLTVDFTDQSTGSVTSWDWDFGDGSAHSNAQNPTHQYTSAGDYTVTLTVSGACGSDAATKTDYISVGATLVADFSGTPTSGCAPLTVDFTDASSGDITSWDWDFGDGSAHSSAQNPTHEYASGGDYTVTLTVTGSCGSDAESKTNYIHVDSAPVADFSGSPTSGTAPLTVDFTDQSTGSVTSWDWDFGDGSAHSSAQNPTHEYTAEGLYTVSLTVSGSCGSDTKTRTDYINVSASTGFCDDFNDGDASDWTVVAGTWSVVSSQYDGVNTSTKGFTLAPVSDMADGTITVDWTSLTGGSWTNGQILFGWTDSNNYRCIDMRDGANKWYIREYIGGTRYNRAQLAETINTNQQYHLEVVVGADGKVTLNVDGVEKVSYTFSSVTTGAIGLGIEKSHSQFDNFCVTAEQPTPPPVAAFSGSPTSGCAPLTVNFTDESTGEITSWDWDFGDGSAHSSAQNPAHQYTAPGNYTVSLTVTGPGGSDTDTKTDYISVDGAPVAAFYGSPTSGPAPLTVTFHDQSTGSITSWDWDFGDGSTHSSAQNPTHEYTAEGLYTVSLTVSGACGSDSETKTDYINVTGGGPVVVGEIGSFSHDQADGNTWYTVNLNHTYASPVVIAKSLSFNGGNPSHLRVRNVTSSSFEWQIEEWEYLDGAHIAETISYMVIEAGRHQLDDGTVIEAGTADVTNSWATVSFSQNFGATPALLSAVTTYNDPVAVVTRTRNLGTAGFDIKVQEEEAQDQTHGTETVAWVAVEQGTGTDNGLNYHAGRTSNSVTHDWYTISLSGFTSTPIFLCHDDTYDGGNTCGPRWQNLSSGSVEVKIEEEQSQDSEVNHITEAVSFLAWGGAGDITTTAGASGGNPEVAERSSGEAPEEVPTPAAFDLSRNYPNPFNPATRFTLSLPVESRVTFAIYNVMGQRIKTLVDHRMSAGVHYLTWNGRNDSGTAVASGIYLCRIEACGEVLTRKIILAR